MTKIKLADCFDILPAIQDDKMNFEKLGIDEKDSIPFLGRSALNNGIVGYVSPKKGFINKGGVITIALDGSTGATFYQHHNFSSGQNIWLLVPRDDYFKTFDHLTALYCITSIRRAVENYVGSYNLSLTKTRLTNNIEVFLPLNKNNTVNVNYIKKEMQKLRNISLLEKLPSERFFYDNV